VLPGRDARRFRRHSGFRFHRRAQVVRRGPVPGTVPGQVQSGHPARVHPEPVVETAQQQPPCGCGGRRRREAIPEKGPSRRRGDDRRDKSSAASAQTVLRAQQTGPVADHSRRRDGPEHTEGDHVERNGRRGMRVFVIHVLRFRG